MRAEGHKEVSHGKIQGQSSLSRGNSLCQGPEVQGCLVQEQQGSPCGCKTMNIDREEMGQRTLGTASFLTFSLRETGSHSKVMSRRVTPKDLL